MISRPISAASSPVTASGPLASTATGPKPAEWAIGQSGPLDTAILFVDLINSTDFASVMGLQEYAEYVDSFQQLGEEQCRFFFQELHSNYYPNGGVDYGISAVGDELTVFLHTPNSRNDVYQLICLAIALKCAWLSMPRNLERTRQGLPATQLAVGIHFGKVWATRAEEGFKTTGFAISLAKRTETFSRQGERFRIFVTDTAYKLINRRIRNLMFGPRQLTEMKGILVPIGIYEVHESFVNPVKRLAPQFREGFLQTALQALETNTFDLWIHSCLQVASEAEHGCVTDVAFELCRQLLNIDPRNAVALYYLAQGYREHEDLETAELLYADLVRQWPHFSDGWLEYARLLRSRNKIAEARHCVLQARRCGIAPDEEPLPELPAP